jgi:hypothetical protein
MTEPTLTPAAFAAKWKGVETTEKASAQSHFIDLCRMLGEPTPHEADPIGSTRSASSRLGEGRASPTSGNATSSPGSTRANTRI